MSVPTRSAVYFLHGGRTLIFWFLFFVPIFLSFFFLSFLLLVFFFFFSSRRRHTSSLCDWSSDVCSSDLRRRLLVGHGARVLGDPGRQQELGQRRGFQRPALGKVTAQQRPGHRRTLLDTLHNPPLDDGRREIGRASCRERV